MSHVKPTGEVWQISFLGGFGRRVVAQTHQTAPKMPRVPSAFPLKGTLLAPDHKNSLYKEGQSLGDDRLRVENAGQGAPRQTTTWTKTHSTRSAHRQSAADRRVSHPSASQRVVDTFHSAWRPLVFVFHPTKRTSMAQGFYRWVRRQGRSPDTLGIPKNASGPVGIPLKRAASGARQWTKEGQRLEDASQGAPWPTAPGTRTHLIRSAHRQSAANRSASQSNAS